MTSTASCLAITTLVVVSLANMLLLVHMILVKRCDDLNQRRGIAGIRPRDGRPLDDAIQSYQAPITSARFMSAIVFVGDNEMKFICGAAIISKNWAITPAHCAEIIMNRFMDNIKLASNASKVKNGILHDVENVIMHEKFDSLRRYNDVALIKISQSFKGKFVAPVALAGHKYKYVANSSATTLGWTTFGEGDNSEHLYGVDVKLYWFKNCEIQYADENISDNAMFCAGKYKNEKNVCVYDYGGQLVQDNLLIGLVSFGIGCDFGGKPVVYTKLGMFESWIKAVETREGESISVVFKTKT